jgi:hypothetical protein
VRLSLSLDQPSLKTILRSALKLLSPPDVVVELVVKFPALVRVKAVAYFVGFLQQRRKLSQKTIPILCQRKPGKIGNTLSAGLQPADMKRKKLNHSIHIRLIRRPMNKKLWNSCV